MIVSRVKSFAVPTEGPSFVVWQFEKEKEKKKGAKKDGEPEKTGEPGKASKGDEKKDEPERRWLEDGLELVGDVGEDGVVLVDGAIPEDALDVLQQVGPDS